jgi:hypothetical protein
MGFNEAKKLLIDIGRYNTSNKDENIKISYNTYSRRADSIMASFQLICHVHFLPESDTF